MRHVVVIAIASLILTACASRPQNADVLVLGDSAMNPDSYGRPSPVILKLYQLKELRAFKSADYFQLSQAVEPFSPEILSIEELIVQPDDVMRFTRPIAPNAKYLATFAAFRDLNSARWRNTGDVGNVRTVEVPFTNWGYRQDLSLLIDVRAAKVELSSPAATVVLSALEATAKANKSTSKTLASIGSQASVVGAQVFGHAETKSEQILQEKAENALVKNMPALR